MSDKTTKTGEEKPKEEIQEKAVEWMVTPKNKGMVAVGNGKIIEVNNSGYGNSFSKGNHVTVHVNHVVHPFKEDIGTVTGADGKPRKETEKEKAARKEKWEATSTERDRAILLTVNHWLDQVKVADRPFREEHMVFLR